MQRISAILLLAVFSVWLIGPAFANADSKRPACCRRDGKHRCSMMSLADQQPSSSGLAVKSARQKCPYFPKAGAVPAHSKTILPKNSQAIAASIVSYPAIRTHAEAHYRNSFARSHQKRGPPILLA